MLQPFALPNELLINTLATQFPCRDAQIRTLFTLLSVSSFHGPTLFPCLLLFLTLQLAFNNVIGENKVYENIANTIVAFNTLPTQYRRPWSRSYREERSYVCSSLGTFLLQFIS
jgi:hypothetical protein